MYHELSSAAPSPSRNAPECYPKGLIMSPENGPDRERKFVTTSSTPVEPVYGPQDSSTNGEPLGAPGQYPFTRGIHKTGYRGKLWTMRMFAGFGSAEETNERFRYLLSQGTNGLSIAFDMATLYGYDADAPEAMGEFGKCGVGVSSLRDMEILLDELPLADITTSMTINSPAAVIWAMYIAAAGVHRTERVPLPARAIDAPCRGHDRVRLA